MFCCSDFVSLVSGRLSSASSMSSSEISCFSFAVFSVLFRLTFGERSVECLWSLLLSLLVRWLFPFTREVFPPSVPLYCSLSAVWCWLYAVCCMVDLRFFLTLHLLYSIRLSFWIWLLTSLCWFLVFFLVFLMLGTCTTAVADPSGPWSAMNFCCSSKWYSASMCERDGRKPFPPSPSFLSSYSLCYIWQCHSLSACL